MNYVWDRRKVEEKLAEKGITVSELADQLGYTRQGLLAALGDPSPERFFRARLRVCDALNLEITDVLYRVPNAQQEGEGQ